MATQIDPRPMQRSPLSKDRVLAAAVELADRDGLEALSMRRLGAELGVEAMALYRHVGNKDELIDIESFTDARWGVPDGPIEWADLGPTQGSGCN